MAVTLVPPDLGAENGLIFPSLYDGQRVYSPEEAPELALDEIANRVRSQLQPILGRVALDERVAITAGSRGIANMPAILRACGEAIREVGGDPFVMPAMGSFSRMGGALTAGTEIDRYRLLSSLGEGGFAWVYKAEHTFLKRTAALKVLKPFSGGDEDDRARSRPRPARQSSQTAHRLSRSD